jgi:hypothetical protein
MTVHDHAHVDLAVSLLNDHLADLVLTRAKQDAKLQLAHITFTKAERMTEALSLLVCTVGLSSEDPPDAWARPIR